MSEGTKKSILKRWWFWVVAIVVIAIIGSMAGGKKESAASSVSGSTERSADAEKTKEAPPMAVTAKDLHDAYESNEVSADSRYKGKRLAVTGEIDGVDKVLGTVSVNLKADEYFKRVRCKLKNESDAASLTKGQTVTLIGVGDGKTIFPEVEDCVLASK